MSNKAPENIWLIPGECDRIPTTVWCGDPEAAAEEESVHYVREDVAYYTRIEAISKAVQAARKSWSVQDRQAIQEGNHERNELAALVDRLREQLRQAIPAVRNTAPPGYLLVPAEPTPEMIDAALDAHMPLGDMTMAIQCANAEAPEPDQ